MQSKYWMFTRFQQHGTLDFQQVKKDLEPLCSYFIFQEEISPDTGRHHLQGYLALKKRTRRDTIARKFPAHYEPRRGSHAEAKAYCSKEETKAGGTTTVEYGSEPTSDAGRRDDISDFRDAILDGASDWMLLQLFPTQMAKFPRFLHMVRATKLSSDVLRNLAPFVPRDGWQHDLSIRLSQPPDTRQVHWRWEHVGNVGKSFFALNYEPGRTFVVTGGKHADIHFSYAYQPIVFFDWARCAQDSFPYGLVEQFKNGYFFSSKYESREKRFPIPHVVVFANFHPEVAQMSADRWDIVHIL